MRCAGAGYERSDPRAASGIALASHGSHRPYTTYATHGKPALCRLRHAGRIVHNQRRRTAFGLTITRNGCDKALARLAAVAFRTKDPVLKTCKFEKTATPAALVFSVR